MPRTGEELLVEKEPGRRTKQLLGMSHENCPVVLALS